MDTNGDCFCVDLGHRGHMTGEMWKNKPPFRLWLNKDLAKDMGVPLQTTVGTRQKHFGGTKKHQDYTGQSIADVCLPDPGLWICVSAATGCWLWEPAPVGVVTFFAGQPSDSPGNSCGDLCGHAFPALPEVVVMKNGAQLDDAKDDIGDTWTWKAAGASIIKGLMLAMSVPPGYGYGPLATRADASVLLSSLGFMELEVVEQTEDDVAADPGPAGDLMQLGHRQEAKPPTTSCLRACAISCFKEEREKYLELWVGQGRPDVRDKSQNDETAFTDSIAEASMSAAHARAAKALELLAFCSAENVRAWVGSTSGEVYLFNATGADRCVCLWFHSAHYEYSADAVEVEWHARKVARDEVGGLKPPTLCEGVLLGLNPAIVAQTRLLVGSADPPEAPVPEEWTCDVPGCTFVVQGTRAHEKDPEGGPFPAYPSGKTWDEPSGKTGSGKKFFHNIIDGSKVPTEPFYVAIITPVIHYCMGGLECTTEAECIDKSGKPIPGLYVAGEAAGGIHGNNRLGGNSLLDCVVFGRVAGKAACKYTFGAADKFKPCPTPGEIKDLTK
ncbi:osm1 [Symbiodinium pilosum]|uniref:Osm1 protein n=1 Tax=Symbiodinium pilosum TaxID=2952 RepID=A0A812QKR6_SYMPI|nr:osm1 [Symbiodinium pilosum]